MTKREPDYWLPKWKKREIKARVMANGKRDSMTTVRKLKRQLRYRLRHGTFNEIGLELPKPGKFISTVFDSSHAFISAYSFARSEAEWNEQAMYADY